MKKLALAALALALVAGPARASEPERKDYQVFTDLANSVLGYTQYTIFDNIEAKVQDGHVRLTGKVTMPYKREDIERRAARVAGVKSVRNEITVLPVSQFDDELRYRIARAIYGNSSFWRYASMANPPIHIVVDRGRVTLTGVVNSNVERMLARSIATGYGAFSVTNALKTDAEVQAAVETSGD